MEDEFMQKEIFKQKEEWRRDLGRYKKTERKLRGF
jgi:hypothetical protein